MSILVIDANIPITFIKTDIWKIFEQYIEKTKHSVIMPEEVYNEVSDWKTKQQFQQSTFIKKIQVNEESFKSLKSDCLSTTNFRIQDNDYKLITIACDKNADYLVSNDYKLILTAKRYLDQKTCDNNNFLVIGPAGLFWLMYSERKDVFEFKKNMSTNLKYYKKIEIERMYDGIKNKGWDCSYCTNAFEEYQENILRAVQIIADKN